MNCQWTGQLQAYHDGELPAADQAALQGHLSTCPACQAELDALKQLSGLVGSATLSMPPAGYAARVRHVVMAGSVAWDAGVGRLAGWLTAAAAVLLLAVQLMAPLTTDETAVTAVNNTNETTIRLAAWEVAATSPPRPQREGGNGDLTRAAEWIASDLAMATPAQ